MSFQFSKHFKTQKVISIRSIIHLLSTTSNGKKITKS
jgi:hypothetical protein